MIYGIPFSDIISGGKAVLTLLDIAYRVAHSFGIV